MPLNSKQKAEIKGRLAEWIASIWLNLKGYRILNRRYKSPLGEVDLIAQRRHALVFVEVKYRSTFDLALEAVSPSQQRRIIGGAKYFLKRFPITPRTEIRFDVICLYGFKLKHVKAAWRES